MKRMFKSTLAFVIVLTMLICSINVFAATSDIYSSHVEFVGEAQSLSANAFVYSKTDAEAQLIVAVYDNSGKLTDAKSVSGTNKVLKTEGVNAANGIVKAFVWANDTKEVISEIATFDANEAAVLSSLEITFDGASFESYIGAPFDTNTKSYTKTLSGSGEITIPEVKASVKNNGASVRVNTERIDDYNAKTTVIVEYGKRSVSTKTTKNGVEREVYTYPVTAVYEIGYNVTEQTAEKDPNKIYVEDFDFSVDRESLHGTNSNGRMGGNYEFRKKYAKDVTLDGDEYKKVTVELSGNNNLRQNVFVTIKAKNAEDMGNVTVKPETSTLPDWAEDPAVRVSYDEATGAVMGEMTAEKTVKAMYGGVQSDDVISRPMFACDKERATGAKFDENRAPMAAHMAIHTAPEDYVGCEYIAPKGDSLGGISELSFEFYIGKDAEIAVWSRVEIGVSIDTEIITAQEPADYFKGMYTNPFVIPSSPTLQNENFREPYKPYADLIEALLIKSGAVKDVDYIRDSNNIKIINLSMPTGYGWDTPYFDSLYRIVLKENDEIVNPTEDSRFSGKIPEQIAELITTFDSSDKGTIIAENTGLVTGLGWAAGLNTTGYTKNPDLKKFDASITNGGDNFGFFADRGNQTGELKGYPGVFDLQNADVIRGNLGWINDSIQEAADWQNKTIMGFPDTSVVAAEPRVDGSVAWMQFEVSADARVMVFTTGGINYSDKAAENGENDWTVITLEEGDYIMFESDLNNFRNLSVKEYQAGDTVTIYSPAARSEYAVVVVPAN